MVHFCETAVCSILSFVTHILVFNGPQPKSWVKRQQVRSVITAVVTCGLL